MVLPLALPVIPAPRSVTVDAGVLPLSPALRVLGDTTAGSLLADAVVRRTGIRLAVSEIDDSADIREDSPRGDIALRIDPGVTAPEGYTLVVADAVRLTGADAAGLAYGLE